MVKKTKDKSIYLIIDGNALAHRAYHSIPQNLITTNGLLVNSVYGFTRMFIKAINDLKPTHVVCTFDLPKATFRSELYPEYKKNRKKMDEQLSSQFKLIKQVLEVFNVPIFEKEGYEADDIIGSLCSNISAKDGSSAIYILSGDRDVLQLIDSNTKVVLSGKTFSDFIIFDEKKFQEKYLFPSKHLIDFKSLYGDKSDNIPGVKGIGEKGATELIQSFGSLDSIYIHLSDINKKLSAKLLAGRSEAYLSKTLATIDRTVELDIRLDDLIFDNFDVEIVKQKFNELEFFSLMNKIPRLMVDGGKFEESELGEVDCAVGPGDDMKNDIKYSAVADLKDYENYMAPLREQKFLFLDILVMESKSKSGDVCVIAMGKDPSTWAYIDVSKILYRKVDGRLGLDLMGLGDLGLHLLIDMLDVSIQKISIQVKNIFHLLEFDYSLKSSSWYDLEISSSLLGKRKPLFYREQKNIKNYYLEYYKRDLFAMFQFYIELTSALNEEENNLLKVIFEEIETPLIAILYKMEKTGIKLDKKYLEKLSLNISSRVGLLKKEIFSTLGHEFNVSSPKQLSAVLYEELKLPVGMKTTLGYSTDDKYLSVIFDLHPIIRLIKEYRELVKLKNTYIDVLPKIADGKSRIHTTYFQNATATGRISSKNPNLQNIPIKTEEGRMVRNAFIAEEGSVLVSFDYSQIELRILASMSNDSVLIESFRQGVDVHLLTAQLIFNKKDISSDERRVAKTINFGIIYGLSGFGLSKQLLIPRNEAESFIKRYFEVYSGVRTYLDEQKKRVLDQEYSESLMGRKRRFPGINNVKFAVRDSMLREALNMPIQATNADIIKIAMLRVSDFLCSLDIENSLLLQIHDELVFEYKVGAYTGLSEIIGSHRLGEFAKTIKGIMESSYELKVPIKVDCSIGAKWGEMQKMIS